MAPRGGSIGRTSKAKAKPKVAPTRAPKRPSARASASSRAQASRAAPGAKRGSVKRKAEEANLGADHWYDLDENCESEATEESWDPTGCDAEDVSDAESEEMADPCRSRHGPHGPSEADRVYAELIRNGATPAIVGKQRKVGKEQPEMELFTPAAAVKAGLIPDPAEGRRHRQSFGFPFGHLFSF
mmetsp:Transcript_62879/g.99711  ORF Transcript_62879/g.99711 Transcript_62879/m.99711 type:complete len:185 (-) Transcript_62879:101-655(-)